MIYCCICGKELPKDTPYAFGGTYDFDDELQYLCVDANLPDCFMPVCYPYSELKEDEG